MAKRTYHADLSYRVHFTAHSDLQARQIANALQRDTLNRVPRVIIGGSVYVLDAKVSEPAVPGPTVSSDGERVIEDTELRRQQEEQQAATGPKLGAGDYLSLLVGAITVYAALTLVVAGDDSWLLGMGLFLMGIYYLLDYAKAALRAR